jgi:electron transport complex protein RnfC
MLEYLPKRRRVSGLRIEARKSESTGNSIAADFIPEQLFIPLDKHLGTEPEIIVTPGQVVLRGETLAAGKPGSCVADVHASSSGQVREVTTIDIRTANGPAQLRCVVIDTDGRDASIRESKPRNEAPIETIRRAGIIGMGGAAVSTSWKLTRSEVVPTLIINGAECEPYISCDDMLMREQAAQILAGSLALCDLLGTEQCIIAIERDKPKAIAAIREAAAAIDDERLHLAELPSIYPAGGERQLVELLIDVEVPAGRFPADIGIICHNVGTARAVNFALTQHEPLISRVVTLTGGGLSEPRNVYARIGTLASDLIAHHGGYAADPAALIVGGSMMGIAQPSDAIPVGKSTNCLLVPDRAEFGAEKPEWPCIRCGECAGACPARLLPQELLRASQRSDAEQLEALGVPDCIECGCCDAICPSHIALTQRFISAKRMLAARREAREFAAESQQRFDERTQRMGEEEAQREQAQEALRARISDETHRQQSIKAVLERAKRSREKDEDR